MPYKDPVIAKQKSQERWDKWAHNNKEKANARMREWRYRNPEYMLVHSARRRAKRDGIPFELTRDNCPPIPETCPIALIPIYVRNDGTKGPCDNSPTLDRVDPTKGYTVDNTRVVSHKGNRWKSDMSIADLERLLDYMKHNSNE